MVGPALKLHLGWVSVVRNPLYIHLKLQDLADISGPLVILVAFEVLWILISEERIIVLCILRRD